MKCKKCGHEIEDSETIISDGWEYDIETTQKGVGYRKIQYPKNGALWDVSDFAKFTTEQWKLLKLDNDWFYIQQPIKEMSLQGYVAGFVANSDWAGLGCYWDPRVSYPELGVRFKRKVKK
jgi:hypothetical protein